MKKFWLLIPFLLCVSASAVADMTTFMEGLNYEAVTPTQPTDVKPGQIEVIEFYWYGCPHCFALEPYVEAWEKAGLPKDVVFKRVPGAMKDSQFYVDAQATFTAEELGIGEKIREPLFNAIHLDGKDSLRFDKDSIRDFFGNYGVKPTDFDAAWDSAAVQADLLAAQKLGERYQLTSVPIIIVNGKWKTGMGYEMQAADIIRCIQFLIDKERATSSK